ncbi:MAG: GLUG motif-containing protein, partial [Planctomycetota bacterium]
MYRARKSSLFGKITILFVICCCCLSAHAKYGGGTGEPNDPYLIYTAEQMNAIGADSNDWDKHFLLCADIDLGAFTGTSFNIIGTDYHNTFTGVFDGNDHTISYFSYTSTGRNFIGMFGFLYGSDAEIKNLGLIAPNVDAGSGKFVGSLVGQLVNGTVTKCYVKGGSVSGRYYTGGLVGMNYGTITNCYTSGSFTGDKYTGGLVGESFSGTINNCYTTGSVSGRYVIGGLSGNNSGTMINSYSTADVTGDDIVGGLTGYNRNSIKYCYSTGTVFGNLAVGGLVGSGHYESVLGCFWDIQTSGQASSSGGTGKTTDQMKDLNTFLYWGVCVNEGVWTIDDGNDYPRLAWQNLPGVPIVTSEPVYGGGSGSEADPYQICTAERLNKIGLIPCHWDKHFLLCADIDLSGFTGSEFNIIGSNYYNQFSGVFGGNGHQISNFTYTSTYRNSTGLFGYVSGAGAEIKNLGLIGTNVYVETGQGVGSLVGELEVGTISNCYVEGGSVSGEHSVGGLVGSNNGTITDCYATASVFGDYQVGGMVGYNVNSIVDCYTSGNVGGEYSSYVGGLCGRSAGPHHGTGQSRIQNCLSKATVTGNYSVGGLIGHNGRTVTNCYSTGSVIGRGDHSGFIGGLIGSNGGHGSIKNCYSIGGVVGDVQVGGLVGNNVGTVVASYWDIETSEQAISDAGTGLTTGEMQMAITFVCWGYEPAWTIDEGVDYPRLLWENKPGELITVPSDLYGGGSGEPEDPYLIYTAEQLNTIGLYTCHLDKQFKLMADIDLREFTGTSFNIIGNGYHNPFRGVFDGNGRKIFNFVYTSTDKNYIGLFGCVRGVIKDLGLIDPNVDAATVEFIGPLVGRLHYFGSITNCYVEGGSVIGDSYVGGLVGYNDHGKISKCYSTTTVS